MALNIVPTFALNLMSCTVPVGNTTDPIETFQIPSRTDLDVRPFSPETVILEKRRHTISLPINKSEYERFALQNTRTPVKVRRMKNRNQHYRRRHNIKQPGRTNCTQRLFA